MLVGDPLKRYRDNSTALLLITLVVTMLSTASTDVEKLILYRLLADASIEMPEVITMAYVSRSYNFSGY